MSSDNICDLLSRMADELDHYRQLLTDDRREVHPLAAEARAALAAAPEGEAMQRLLDAPIDDRWYADLRRPATPPEGELTDKELLTIASDCRALYVADDVDDDNYSEVLAAMRAAIAADRATPPAGQVGEVGGVGGVSALAC